MENKINEIIKNIKIPNSDQTLGTSGRVQDVAVSDGELQIKYKRDGIDPKSKRIIEDRILLEVKEYFTEDQVTLLTTSKSSQDVFAKGTAAVAPEAKAQATIQAGHGPATATKKRIPGAKRVIAISSGKGGVGKSTVSVNLAIALKNQGKKVGILDADIYGPSIPMLLGKRDAKPVPGEANKIAPIEAHGIKFISFGLFIKENDAVIWRGPMLGGVLNQFLFDVEWNNLDYVIIDLPPGTGDMQLSLAQSAEIDGVVTVSTPQDVALLDAVKGIKMFEKVKVPTMGLIENMSYFVPEDNPGKKYFIFGENGVKKASEELDMDFLGQIPLEIALREGSDKGVPYMSNPKYEGRPVWNSYMEIAKKIDESLNKEKGFFSKIFKK